MQTNNTVFISGIAKHVTTRVLKDQELYITEFTLAQESLEAKNFIPVTHIGKFAPENLEGQMIFVNPHDAHGNVAGGARYLAQQKKRFGSWELALAAYNAGPGSVRRFGGVPPFAETQNYVVSNLARAEKLKHLEGLPASLLSKTQ